MNIASEELMSTYKAAYVRAGFELKAQRALASVEPRVEVHFEFPIPNRKSGYATLVFTFSRSAKTDLCSPCRVYRQTIGLDPTEYYANPDEGGRVFTQAQTLMLRADTRANDEIARTLGNSLVRMPLPNE